MVKSGHVAQKIAATPCSAGTPAMLLHAAGAIHGDMAMYTPGDSTILLSKSAATAELVQLLSMLGHFQSALIGILGNLTSVLTTFQLSRTHNRLSLVSKSFFFPYLHGSPARL